MSEWISVKDKPPQNGFYLCYYRAEGADDVTMCCVDYIHTWITPDYVEVTHWMPLPVPPRGDT